MTGTGSAFWAGAGQGWWVEPISLMEFHCAPEWHVLPRTIPDYMLWYGRAGVATLRMNGYDYPLLAGDVLLVPPGVVHAASHDPARPLHTITTHFVFRDAAGAPMPLASEDLPPVRCSPQEPLVFDAYFARLLTLEALGPPGRTAITSGLLLVVLAELWREHAQATATHPGTREEVLAIAQALRCLESDGQYFVTPGTLARACGFSTGYFSRLFRQQFGRTPQEHLVSRRIARARHLLMESDLSVQQVAQSLGYRDTYFFTRQFKQHVGQPPAAFRAAARHHSGEHETGPEDRQGR